ncbi:PREDICTED: GDSL esterase/lipase At4g30140-like [Tarenaya hassleriana]|uniref:GDSL esterase/lipase At4g30140-like n=1 Tax=Tarenaya hassleriana TaxID=28532 RepID=UPI00053C373B|nr:PREDICTED: GDSL esterase/lipase At4g30140-like [Tarenaya hassleriana]
MFRLVSPKMWVILATVVGAMAVAARAQKVPCYFVFGDSVFDNGNNNHFAKSKAKVNYWPYGIDFARGPTGRFSNGRNIPDFIAEFLGFKNFIPPFAGSPPAQVQIGFNYASGGAGIRDETSQHLGGRISLSQQVSNHRGAIAKGGALARPERLNKCLYTINIGSNDYINNYFVKSIYSTSRQYTPDKYAYSLVNLYATHLKSLYDLGGRKFVLFGISRIGCIPRVVETLGGGKGCAEEVNVAAVLFNKQLKALVARFNKYLPGAKFTFVDMQSGDVSKLGFTVVNKSCCTVEPGQELCAANRPVCPDRTKYVFWDKVHGTEAVNDIVAKGLFMGVTTSPYTIDQLIK